MIKEGQVIGGMTFLPHQGFYELKLLAILSEEQLRVPSLLNIPSLLFKPIAGVGLWVLDNVSNEGARAGGRDFIFHYLRGQLCFGILHSACKLPVEIFNSSPYGFLLHCNRFVRIPFVVYAC